MDLRDTPEEAAFRAELRAWIEANLTDEGRRGAASRGLVATGAASCTRRATPG